MIITKNPKLLSISVMAHPSREKFFPYLQEKLGYNGLFPETIPFSIDEKSEGVWPNCKKAWMLHDPEAAYHVVVQDDAIVCDKFRERAEQVIADAHRRMIGPFAISFYFGRRGNALEEGKSALERGYATRQSPTWGVAICLPTNHILPMLEYADGFDYPQDDARIARYLRKHNIRTYFPMPSLIDHRTAAETASLVGDPGENRCAYAFIDRI